MPVAPHGRMATGCKTQWAGLPIWKAPPPSLWLIAVPTCLGPALHAYCSTRHSGHGELAFCLLCCSLPITLSAFIMLIVGCNHYIHGCIHYVPAFVMEEKLSNGLIDKARLLTVCGVCM